MCIHGRLPKLIQARQEARGVVTGTLRHRPSLLGSRISADETLWGSAAPTDCLEAGSAPGAALVPSQASLVLANAWSCLPVASISPPAAPAPGAGPPHAEGPHAPGVSHGASFFSFKKLLSYFYAIYLNKVNSSIAPAPPLPPFSSKPPICGDQRCVWLQTLVTLF